MIEDRKNCFDRYAKSHYVKVFLLFMGLAIIYQLLAFTGRYPYVFLTGDAGNIASFAAAQEFSACFTQDGVLNDPIRFQFYQNVHLYWLPMLKGVIGDYGTAFHSVLWLHIVLQGFGFYWLGFWLWHDNVLALLLALVTLIYIDIGAFAEFWGIALDALPRITFQAFFPYLLLLAFASKDAPRYWIFSMISAGLLWYINPPSAIPMGFALWLGFVTLLPPTWSIRPKLMLMLAIGGGYVFVVTPFLHNYLTSTTHGETVNYSQISEIIAFRFRPDYFNLPEGLKTFLLKPTIFLLTLTSGISWYGLSKIKKQGNIVKFIIGMIAGIGIIAVGFPLMEYGICRILHRAPVQYTIIRGVRLLVPLSLLLTFLGIASLSKWKYGLALLLVTSIAVANFSGETFLPIKRWIKYSWGPTRYEQDTSDALIFLKSHACQGGAVLSLTVDPLAIRYYALKSVVYAWKDGGILAYTDHQALVKWYEKHQKIAVAVNAYKQLKDPHAFQQLMMLAKEMQATYLIAKTDVITTSEMLRPIVVFQNNSHTIIDLNSVEYNIGVNIRGSNKP